MLFGFNGGRIVVHRKTLTLVPALAALAVTCALALNACGPASPPAQPTTEPATPTSLPTSLPVPIQEQPTATRRSRQRRCLLERVSFVRE